jgi:hypothetical protein
MCDWVADLAIRPDGYSFNFANNPFRESQEAKMALAAAFVLRYIWRFDNGLHPTLILI